MGRMTHEEALHANYRNVITRALGTQPTVEPDIFSWKLWRAISPPLLRRADRRNQRRMIEAILGQKLPLDELCVHLIEAAKQAGGHDNITCTLIRAEG